MHKRLLSLTFILALAATSKSFAEDKIRCGIGNDPDKLEHVKEGELERKDKTVTVRFEGPNRYGIKYYQAKIYFDYKEEGDKDKDVVELILAPTVGYTAISSQKVRSLEGGEAFSVYLMKSPTNYVPMLCLIETDEQGVKKHP